MQQYFGFVNRYLCELLFGKGNQLVKIQVNQFLFRQFLQRAILSGINDDAFDITIQPELDQIHIDFNGDFVVRNGGVGYTYFVKI